jgi:hypothetical protein
VTVGGGPTAAQRASLKLAMKGRSVRSAVVSDSVKVRFIIASVALINREHHGFSTRELGKAYDFLQLTSAERQSTEAALQQLGKLLAS